MEIAVPRKLKIASSDANGEERRPIISTALQAVTRFINAKSRPRRLGRLFQLYLTEPDIIDDISVVIQEVLVNSYDTALLSMLLSLICVLKDVASPGLVHPENYQNVLERSLLWFLKQLNRIENVSLMHLMLKHSHKQSVIILSEFLQKVYGIELATQRSMHSYRQFRREIVCIAAKVNCSNITSWWLSHRSNRLGQSIQIFRSYPPPPIGYPLLLTPRYAMNEPVIIDIEYRIREINTYGKILWSKLIPAATVKQNCFMPIALPRVHYDDLLSPQSSFHLEVLFGGVALPHKLAFFVQFLQCKLLTSFALQRNKKVKLYYDLPFHFYGWQRTPSSTYSQDNLLKTAPQFCAAVSEDQIPLTLKLPKSLGDIVLKGKRTHDGRCLEFRLPSELPVGGYPVQLLLEGPFAVATQNLHAYIARQDDCVLNLLPVDVWTLILQYLRDDETNKYFRSSRSLKMMPLNFHRAVCRAFKAELGQAKKDTSLGSSCKGSPNCFNRASYTCLECMRARGSEPGLAGVRFCATCVKSLMRKQSHPLWHLLYVYHYPKALYL